MMKKGMMKNLLALLLCMALVLPCMPVALADGAEEYVPVTYLSTNSTPYETANTDPSVVFQDNALYYSGLQTSGGAIITGEMDGNYVITKIIVRTPKANANRTKESYIEASVDNVNWVQLAQQNTAATGGVDNEFVLTVTDTNAYKYIRIRQNSKYQKYALFLTSLLVVGTKQEGGVQEPEATESISVSYVSDNGTPVSETDRNDPNVVFQDNDLYYEALNANGGVNIVGKLNGSYYIKKVTIRTPGANSNRTKESFVEASVDGEGWVVIAQQNTASTGGDQTFVLPIIDPNAYRYIRLRQNSKYQDYSFAVTEIAVEGIAAPVSYLTATYQSAIGTPISATENADPASVFANDETYYAAKDAASGVTVSARLDGNYVLERVTVKAPAAYPNATKNAYIEASINGETWVTLVQQTNDAVGEGEQTFSMDIADTGAYRFVRIRQDDAAKGTAFAVTAVLFEGVSSRLPVTFLESNHRGDRNPSHSFMNDDVDYHAIGKELDAGGCEPIYGTGELAEASVITKVIVRSPASNAGRMRSMKVYASLDGKTWDLLATCPSSITENTVYTFDIDSSKLYRYIKYEQDAYCASQKWWFGMGSVLVEGYGVSLLQDATVYGYQFSLESGADYAIRFVGTINHNDYTEVGMKIVASTWNGEKQTFLVPVSKFSESLKYTEDSGEQKEITAASLGAKYFYTVVLDNIPTDCGYVTFDVTPYVIKDGNEMESLSAQIVLKDKATASATRYNLLENEKYLKVSGRSYELTDGIACDFTASGIEFNAVLAGDVSIKVNCSAATYYTLYLNGERQNKRLCFGSGTAEYLIAEDLPAGFYNVKLVKQTHVAHSLSALIELSVNGYFTDAPTDKKHFIEFIGDSITCGYGVVGYPTNGVTYYGTSEFCDSTEAYAYKTAQLLDTDYSMISVSGWAVLSSGNNCIPRIYDKTSWQRGETLYTPTRKTDIVVVHLGTNDKGMDTYDANFIKEASDFLVQIKAMHPDAVIVWAYGSMMSGNTLTVFENKLKTIMADMGGEAAGYYMVRVTTNTAAGNGHPSAAGHTAAAEDLAKFITEKGLLK